LRGGFKPFDPLAAGGDDHDVVGQIIPERLKAAFEPGAVEAAREFDEIHGV
jgi:hypothetical protein